MNYSRIEDRRTAVEQGFQSGQNTRSIVESNQELPNSIMYMAPCDDGKGFSLDSGLAYSMASLPACDINKSGYVESNEIINGFGKYLDLDQNGLITPGEDVAYSMWTDKDQNGIQSKEERDNAEAILSDPKKACQAQKEISLIYQENNLAQKNGNLGIPSDVSQQGNQCQSPYAQGNQNQGISPYGQSSQYSSQSPYGQDSQGLSESPYAQSSQNPSSLGQSQPTSQANTDTQADSQDPVQCLQQILKEIEQELNEINQNDQADNQDRAKFPQSQASAEKLKNLEKLKDIILQLLDMVGAQGQEDDSEDCAKFPQSECLSQETPQSNNDSNNKVQNGGIQHNETKIINIIVKNVKEAAEFAKSFSK
jgi:hypothetical protein